MKTICIECKDEFDISVQEFSDIMKGSIKFCNKCSTINLDGVKEEDLYDYLLDSFKNKRIVFKFNNMEQWASFVDRFKKDVYWGMGSIAYGDYGDFSLNYKCIRYNQGGKHIFKDTEVYYSSIGYKIVEYVW